MIISPDSLPNDIELLKYIIIEMARLHAEETARTTRLLDQLQNQIERFLRHAYGQRAERVDPNQMELALASAYQEGLLPEPDGEILGSKAKKSPTKKRQIKGHGRRKLPEKLRRERIEYPVDPADLDCPQCLQPRVKISERVTEQLEFVPASLFVRQHVELIHACKDCEEHVISGKKPQQPIAKGLAGPGLLAQVLTSKYGDHLPLYRQQQIFARHGVQLQRSTLCGWIRSCADLLEPIVVVMKTQIMCTSKIHTDDTPVAVIDNSLGKTRQGRVWVYIGGEKHEHTVFDYTQTRERAGPEAFLQGFSGYLQADAYPGYDQIYDHLPIQEVACWAHARRKFFEASKSMSGESFTALVMVRQLYQIEEKAKDLSADQRRDFRQKHAKPVLNAIKNWLDTQQDLVRPKSQLGNAIGYALRQWDALVRYTEDGRLEIDNNRAERSLRGIAIGRKNWMFLGNDDSGRRTAVIYSLIVSCKNLGIDPFVYLRDVLTLLPAHPPEQIEELTPRAWLDANQEHVDAA